ncbi:MAG: BatA domain-containing protein [Verrucomicrobiales bacterium]
MITLANPYGLWALIGLPVVIAIHFLQRKSIVLHVSTLFLLEKTQRESASGRRFDRLMNSVPLWMQLLAILLLTWLLCEPRYQKPRSTQRIAVVLDSSASMAVFKDRMLEQLAKSCPH